MKFKQLIIVFLLFGNFCLKQLPAVSKDTPKLMECNKPKLYLIGKNDDEIRTLFNEIIPNPIVYLYGKSTSNEPIFLMAFSSTIPVNWIENKKKFLIKTSKKKTSDLDSIVLKLKIPPQYGYYFKILQVSADQVKQRIGYSNSVTVVMSGSASVSTPIGSGATGNFAGLIGRKTNESMVYDVENPILIVSGVGSDTLTLSLYRGKKYPIANGQIRAYLLVRGIKDRKMENFQGNKIDCLIQKISGYCANSNTGYCGLSDIIERNNIFDEDGNKIEDITNLEQLAKTPEYRYKNIHEFIKSLRLKSPINKYYNREALIDAVVEKAEKDKDLKDSISKLFSCCNNPEEFLKKLDGNYVKVNCALNKNTIDFINSIKNGAADVNKFKGNNFKDKVAFYRTDAPDIIKNLSSNNPYENAYTVKNKLFKYNNAIEFIKIGDVSKYVYCYGNPSNNRSDKCKTNKFGCKITKLDFKEIVDCSNQNNAADFLDKTFGETKATDINDFIKKFKTTKVCDTGNIDDFIASISRDRRIKNLNDLLEISDKDKPGYDENYSSCRGTIILLQKIFEDKDLISLVKDTKNNVDLYFEKTIDQSERITIGKSWIMNWWLPPLISKGIVLPIGILFYPPHEERKKIKAVDNVNTSKIILGTYFDKDSKDDISTGVAEGNGGYIRDDRDLKNGMDFLDLIHIEKPTISQPPQAADIETP